MPRYLNIFFSKKDGREFAESDLLETEEEAKLQIKEFGKHFKYVQTIFIHDDWRMHSEELEIDPEEEPYEPCHKDFQSFHDKREGLS